MPVSSWYLGKIVPIKHPPSVVWVGEITGITNLLAEMSVSQLGGVMISTFDTDASVPLTRVAIQVNNVPPALGASSGILVDALHPFELFMDGPITQLAATSVTGTGTFQVVGF